MYSPAAKGVGKVATEHAGPIGKRGAMKQHAAKQRHQGGEDAAAGMVGRVLALQVRGAAA